MLSFFELTQYLHLITSYILSKGGGIFKYRDMALIHTPWLFLNNVLLHIYPTANKADYKAMSLYDHYDVDKITDTYNPPDI